MFSKRLDRARRTIGFRLMLWYSAIFVVSTSFLFALAYLLLSSSIERKDTEDVEEKLKEYAAQYQTGGPEALGREVGLEKRSGNIYFVRIAGSDGNTLYFDDPAQWSAFDL